MKYIPFIIASLAVFIADFASKAWVTSEGFETVHVIDNLLAFKIMENDGIAFGIDIPMSVIIIGSLILIGILLYLFKYFLHDKDQSPLFIQILFGIIIGGAIGNLINRIQLGYVVDFISVANYSTFNVADIGITVGLAALFILLLKPKHG